MLNSSALRHTTQAFLSPGVDTIFVCTREGLLLASANNKHRAQANAAIATTIWGDYEAHLPDDDSASAPADLDMMIVEGQHGTLAIQRVNHLYVCAVGHCPTGRLVETVRRLVEATASALDALPAEAEE